MPKRAGLSKKTRFRIFARDEFTCRYCGAQSDASPLVVDHVIAIANGGTSDDVNLITACQSCNQGKGAQQLDSVAPTEADRLRLAQERHEQIQAAQHAMEAVTANREFRQNVVNLWCEIRGSETVDGRTATCMTNMAREHGIERVAGWIEIAEGRLPYANDLTVCKYVCGIRRNAREHGEL